MLITSRRFVRVLALCAILIVVSLTVIARPALSQGTPLVEAIKFANVRSGPGVNYDRIGTIYAGTTYPLIGRYARAPWYLIQLPDTKGWVYTDVVKVTGDPNSVPVSEELIATATAVNVPAVTSTAAPT